MTRNNWIHSDIQTLQYYYDQLINIDELSWAKYLFSKDLLIHRMGDEEQQLLINQALSCGKEQAKRITRNELPLNLVVLAAELGLKIKFSSDFMKDISIRFAEYRPPLDVKINAFPLEKYGELMEAFPNTGLPSAEELYHVILGHELFHFIEEQEKTHIYTRNESIVLWKWFKFSYQSRIRALSEIGAMAFAQALNRLDFSPQVAEVLLAYPIQPNLAAILYSQIQNIAKYLDGDRLMG